MESEISVLRVEKRIRTRVKADGAQRGIHLNELMKAIEKARRRGRSDNSRRLDRSRRPACGRAREESHAYEGFARCPMSAEATVVRTISLAALDPWNKKSKVKKDLTLASGL
jgi:ATP-dependent Lon protease